MGLFRKKSEISPLTRGPVFIDLGRYPLPDEDKGCGIHVVKVIDEQDLRRSAELVQLGNATLIDFSGYRDDMDAAEAIIVGDIPSEHLSTIKINQFTWLIVRQDVVTMHGMGV